MMNLLYLLIATLRLSAVPPELAQVFPDFATEYPSARPHILTGEGFEPSRTEIWVWTPAKGDAGMTNAPPTPGDSLSLPDTPPADARRISPLDVEAQIMIAPLEGILVWVKTSASTSKPYRFNVPKPCWLGPERVEPGASVHVFGFGLRAPWPAPRLALKNAERQYLLRAHPPDRDYRAEESTLLYFDVPTNAIPGTYVDHHFMPAWYNIVHDGWFDGSLVKLWSKATPGSPFTGPAHFGNYIVGNHASRTWSAPVSN